MGTALVGRGLESTRTYLAEIQALTRAFCPYDTEGHTIVTLTV